MNRADLQQLAEDRVLDAAALLDAGRWSGAYYLSGYAVECALKACIARRTREHDFPDKDLTRDSYTHNLLVLRTAAGLDLQFKIDTLAPAPPELSNNWQRVKDWREIARYQRWTEIQARELFEAVTETPNGVLSWIKTYW